MKLAVKILFKEQILYKTHVLPKDNGVSPIFKYIIFKMIAVLDAVFCTKVRTY